MKELTTEYTEHTEEERRDWVAEKAMQGAGGENGIGRMNRGIDGIAIAHVTINDLPFPFRVFRVFRG